MNDKRRSPAEIGRWYAAAAAAGLGLLGGAQDAMSEPVIVFPSGGPVTVPIGSNGDGGITFDLLNSAGSGVRLFSNSSAVPSSSAWNIHLFRFGPLQSHFGAGASGKSGEGYVGVFASYRSFALKLNPGDSVHPFSAYSGVTGSGVTSYGAILGPLGGKWGPGDTGFLPLEVVSSKGAPRAGWAEIHLGSGSQAYDPTLLAWGYNSTPNASDPIPAELPTPAPEPSSLLLLASGAAGLAAYRRRRARRQASARQLRG